MKIRCFDATWMIKDVRPVRNQLNTGNVVNPLKIVKCNT